jgi:hypothetical protein
VGYTYYIKKEVECEDYTVNIAPKPTNRDATTHPIAPT